MSKRFTLILTLLLFTMLYGATIASANDTTYDEYEEHEIVCNDYIPQILTHYQEGESFLTAEVDVEVIRGEAAVWKASLHWVSPDGKAGHDMSDSAKRVQIHIPKQGLGTYKMMAEIAIEGCKTEVKVEQNVRFLDIGDTNKKVYLD